MTNRCRLEWCRRLWPLRPGSAPRLPEQEYKTAKQFGFWFSWFYLVERAGDIPAQLTIESSARLGRERITHPVSGLLAFLPYDPELFRTSFQRAGPHLGNHNPLRKSASCRRAIFRAHPFARRPGRDCTRSPSSSRPWTRLPVRLPPVASLPDRAYQARCNSNPAHSLLSNARGDSVARAAVPAQPPET